jgi:hypothetical protein
MLALEDAAMISQEQMNALVSALLANAAGPASASNDSGSMTARSVDELIAAVRFVSSMRGVSNPQCRGLRMNALRPAGAVFGHGELNAMDQLDIMGLNRRFV